MCFGLGQIEVLHPSKISLALKNVSRRAGCFSSALHSRSQSVETLTNNQRKVDFYCCEYKYLVSSLCFLGARLS